MIVLLVFSFDGSTWEGLFDRIEVWRSRGTAQGPYEAMHGDSWTPARLPVGALGSPPSPAQAGPGAILVGKSVKFLVDEKTDVTVTFTGSDPLTYGQAATQIQAQSSGLLTAFVLNGVLIVQTVEPGVKAILRCVGGEAAPLLGLATAEPDSLAFGLDARIQLKHDEQNYGFTDPHGATTYFYKARFFSSTNSTTNDFSLPVQGLPQTGLDPSSLCRCFVDLVDLSGNAVAGEELLVYNRFSGLQLEGRGVTGGSVKALTDSRGHAELFLVRGSQIVIAVGGTTLTRDLTVPVDPTVESFNLLTAASGTNDLFDVRVPNIPYAVRRTL